MNSSRRAFLFRLVVAAGLCLAPTAFAQDRTYAWKDVARIVAVGDVHGDYEQLVACLRGARVMDDKNQWIGGKTHLVQAGDLFGRGPASRPALDLLMALEPQAEKAGGRVHVLLGNHEAMALAGYYHYLHPDDIASFGGRIAFEKAMQPDGAYGRWLRERSTVIRINDILFLHGGLSADYAALPLKEINERVARSLGRGDGGGAADDPAGPLWYRGLALGDEEEVRAVLDNVRKTHGARHIVIGHTVRPNALDIQTRAGGGVILIDVGMSRSYLRGPAMFLRIENGRFFAVAGEAERELAVAPAAAPLPGIQAPAAK